jgi:hypothetical protein
LHPKLTGGLRFAPTLRLFGNPPGCGDADRKEKRKRIAFSVFSAASVLPVFSWRLGCEHSAPMGTARAFEQKGGQESEDPNRNSNDVITPSFLFYTQTAHSP